METMRRPGGDERKADSLRPTPRGFFHTALPVGTQCMVLRCLGDEGVLEVGFPRLATRAMFSQLASMHLVVTNLQSFVYADDKPHYRVETRDRVVLEENRASCCGSTVRHPNPERSWGRLFKETE
jgi:hypothetical protein